jgi:hypothetical protein
VPGFHRNDGRCMVAGRGLALMHPRLHCARRTGRAAPWETHRPFGRLPHAAACGGPDRFRAARCAWHRSPRSAGGAEHARSAACDARARGALLAVGASAWRTNTHTHTHAHTPLSLSLTPARTHTHARRAPTAVNAHIPRVRFGAHGPRLPVRRMARGCPWGHSVVSSSCCATVVSWCVCACVCVRVCVRACLCVCVRARA